MKPVTSLKYYIYLSPYKIEMLSQQIQEWLARVDKEIEIDLKILKMSLASKNNETLYAKLALILRYLEENDLVGDILNPKEYFKGELYMEWSQIYPGVVFWGGKFNGIVIGLGGSLKNVLGNETRNLEAGISHTPELVRLLSKEVEAIVSPKIVQLNETEVERRILASTHSWADELAVRSYQKCEFVAKKLKEGHYHNEPVLLGTPLYVAITEE